METSIILKNFSKAEIILAELFIIISLKAHIKFTGVMQERVVLPSTIKEIYLPVA